jgi:XTP/dITP diphosphohydrolase
MSIKDMAIYFVTGNENKLKEAEAILGRKLEQINMNIDEIQEIEQDRIIRHKAKSAYEQIKKPVLVEDTGIFISALNGFPGALVKWVLKTIGNEGICRIMKDEKNREVIAKTYFCLYDNKTFNIFTGQLKGGIAFKPQGKSGFGWDPIFIPKGYKKSFAQMSAEEKNKISMRKIALEKLKNFLDTK